MGVSIVSPDGRFMFKRSDPAPGMILAGSGGFKFPHYLNVRIGTDLIYRGKWPTGIVRERFDGKSYALSFWDHLEMCADMDCVLRPCSYTLAVAKHKSWKHKVCLNQRYYLKSVIAAGLQFIEATGPCWDKVLYLGFHLLPLYNMLWRCKMEMLRLNGWYRDPTDPSKAHPVYKEFRENLDAIDKVWKQIGRKVKKSINVSPPSNHEQFMNKLMGKSSRTRGVPVNQEGKGIRWE